MLLNKLRQISAFSWIVTLLIGSAVVCCLLGTHKAAAGSCGPQGTGWFSGADYSCTVYGAGGTDVDRGRFSSADTDKATFIADVMASPAKAFYVSLMTGEAHDRTPSSTEIQDFKDYVNNNAITITVDYPSTTLNSLYLSGPNDYAFYTMSGAISPATLVFHNGSTVLTEIKIDCGNPINGLALPPPPPTNSPPEGTITATCSIDTSNKITYTFVYTYKDLDGTSSSPAVAFLSSGYYAASDTADRIAGSWALAGPPYPYTHDNNTLDVAAPWPGIVAGVNHQVWVRVADVKPDGTRTWTSQQGVSKPADSSCSSTATPGGTTNATGNCSSIYGTAAKAPSGWTIGGMLIRQMSSSAPNGSYYRYPSSGNAPVGSNGAFNINTSDITATTGNSTYLTTSQEFDVYTIWVQGSTTDHPTSDPVKIFIGANGACAAACTTCGCPGYPACVTTYRPVLSTLGADTIAGIGYCGLTDAGNASADIKAYNTTGGSELGAIASGNAAGFRSKTTNFLLLSGAGGNSQGRLTFANVGGTWSGTQYGGSFGGLGCLTDYYKAAADPAPGPAPATIDVGQLSGSQSVQGNVTLNASQPIPTGTHATLTVVGNVYITDDIDYANYTDFSQIPSFQLLVKGNIYVSGDVSSLHGFYVAEPTDATSTTTGYFDTCADSSGPLQVSDSSCVTDLTVYGAVSAARIVPGRTTPSNTTGDTFIYSPELWIGGATSGGGSGIGTTWQSVTSLPPVL